MKLARKIRNLIHTKYKSAAGIGPRDSGAKGDFVICREKCDVSSFDGDAGQVGYTSSHFHAAEVSEFTTTPLAREGIDKWLTRIAARNEQGKTG